MTLSFPGTSPSTVLWDEIDEILREANRDPRVAYQRKVEAIFSSNGKFEQESVDKVFDLLSNVRSTVSDQLLGMAEGSTEFKAAHLRGLQAAIDGASEEINRRFGASLNDTLNTGWTKGVRTRTI